MTKVLVVDDLVEFTAICKTQNQYTFNVFHFPILTVVGATVTEEDMGVDLDNLLAPFYKTILPTNCSWYGSKIQVIKPLRYDPIFRSTNRGAGSLAGDCLPTQVAGVVNAKTGIAKKSARGRFFLPATSEADNDATAVPSAAYITLVNALNTALLGYTGTVVGATSVSTGLAVYSRKDNVSRTIVSLNTRPNWGTTRRRSQIKHADTAPF